MSNSYFSLADQIKKEIGNRILFCSVALFLIVFGLTFYDISTEINQIPARINPQVKALEDFAMNQIMIDNTQTIALKLTDFNKKNASYQIKWVTNSHSPLNNIEWRFPLSWTYNYPLDELAGFKLGYFQISGSFLTDKALISALIVRLNLILIFALTLFIFLYPLAKKIPDKLFIAPINRFLDLIDGEKSIKEVQPASVLPNELTELETRISGLIAQAKQHERNKAALYLGELVAQVAHDIRSPLIALNMMLRDTAILPEPLRIMIRNATQRINDIANNLLSQYRNNKYKEAKMVLPSSPELISALLDSMISEKRAQYQEKNILFQLDIDKETYGVFALIDAADFKRVLSNLINNAVEAMTQQGKIEIKMYMMADRLGISITDNGSGIPVDLQEKIVIEGLSAGKQEGNGIGLASSKRLIEAWGGNFLLKSVVNQGTTVHLALPWVNAPPWFLPAIQLEKGQRVVVLDDDELIHDVWDTRLTEEPIGVSLDDVWHFYTADALINDYSRLPSNAFFLVDYELHGSTLTGLEVIQTLLIASRAVLVTSRADEPTLRLQCETFGIKLMPKAYAEHIPIIFQAVERGNVLESAFI